MSQVMFSSFQFKFAQYYILVMRNIAKRTKIALYILHSIFSCLWSVPLGFNWQISFAPDFQCRVLSVVSYLCLVTMLILDLYIFNVRKSSCRLNNCMSLTTAEP